ncbi:hypothetical protein SNE40_017402 [Patella caerulea]|uniref:Uncharacterized protein n=1 Tax=Patella caerulea TaxID=87958 RepID=A0AAN8PLK3_PATCE
MFFSDVKAAKLTITPSQNLQAGAKHFTLQCSPDYNSTFTKLHTIEIYKQIMGSQKMLFGRIDSTGKFTHGIGIAAPKYEIAYTLSPLLLTHKSYNRLYVEIHNPDCHDAAEYTCEITGETATSSHQHLGMDSKTVTVQSEFFICIMMAE